MDGKDIQLLEIKEARSGNVSYTKPVVIHQSSRTKVTVVPFYIDRSSGKELSVKILTQTKGKPPMDWLLVDEKSTSLNAEATLSLYSSLKKFLALSEQEENGEYIILKPANEEHSFGNHGPEEIAQAILGVLNRPEIAKHLVDKELSNELITAFRSSIRLQELRSAVAQLRQYLESGIKDEQKYQQWCEEHPWAFGNSFVVNDDVRAISASDKVDLMLPTVITGYRDLVELKRPDMEVLNYDSSHNNYYFTSEVSKVIGQCHRYLDVFQEEAARGLRDHPEIVAYHPKATIVIGRSNDWTKEKHRALHGLNSRLNSITIITYDQLLAQGERMIDIVSEGYNE
ncbi:Shedu anti-phage system protein SduA domain-containing protein [Amphibacillus xylanus]|uniref:Shedu protein SduA C-terminal domain-containing protein n=1 Tax=Amphibacillus xylanus (strain ATCC 51415 / DSM 6626 / JCM 7361 / LMG 17667 / NBRC 15112 / Ep01) TaxID=698758 RepID=K0J7W1_AMPXN|nr:Shedu anti-phage system protein SduA domain-containing protein [Amphibacillus xylanus]BAM48058.1 hypothetical protein AXY_19260 [Amphibacillus xylanus NBRC 15112]